MESIVLLRDDFKKFTKFKYPENVRAVASEAITSINRGDFPVPITICDSPIVRAANAILMNPKLAKVSLTIVDHVLECTNSGAFGPAVIDVIVKGLVNIAPELDVDTALKFFQCASTGIVKNFPHMAMIEAYFSIVLSMMSHQDVIISSSAFAAFPQILEVLITEIQKGCDLPKEFRDYCNAPKYEALFQRSERPLYFILYLLFSSISCLALKQEPLWLHVKPPPIGLLFDLLELIVDGYHWLLGEDAQLLCVFEGAVIQAMDNDLALQFVIAFIESFLDTHISLCSSVFNDYLLRISEKSRKNYIPLFFFRSVVTRSETFAARIYDLCDQENTMFISLVDTLCKFAEPNAPSVPVDFSLQKSKLSAVMTDKGKNSFILRSPYEIAMGIVRSFTNAETERMVSFIDSAGSVLMKMLTFALMCSSLSSFSLPCDAVKSMLIILKKHKMNSAFDRIFETICSLNLSGSFTNEEKKVFSIDEKNVKFMQFLCSLSETNPMLFEGKWTELYGVIFQSNVTPSDNYGLKFEDSVLLDVFNGMLAARPMNREFIAKALRINHKRFLVFWKVFKSFFIKALRAREMDMDVFELFLYILKVCIMEESEEMVLEMGVRFVAPGSTLELANKTRVLQQIRHLLAEKVDLVKDGWTSLFQILSPVNYESDPDVLQTSFSVLNLICNDFFHLVPQASIPACVEIIFQFSASDADINLSLSSFDLLWVVVRVMDNSFDQWRSLMEHVMMLILDSRSDVSQCAVRTLGSLMSSNFHQIPRTVFGILINEGFPKLLSEFNLSKQTSFSEFSLTLQELAHYTATFWDTFSLEPSFLPKFVPLLIEKQTEFVLKCENEETITRGFPFYECLFQCSKLDTNSENLLRKSIITINEKFMAISDQSSIIFSCYGKLMGKIMSSLKDRSAEETLPLWFPVISNIVQTCKSVQFVHITPQRALDPIPLLVPMSEDTTFQLVSLLLSFLEYKDSPALPKYVASLLANMWKSDMQTELRCKFIVKCKPLFSIPEAEPLMSAILSSKVDLDEGYGDELFSCYTTMSNTCKTLDKLVNGALVILVDKMTKEAQRQFIEKNRRDFHILSLLWKTFFNCDSDKFNQEIYENIFGLALDCLADLLQNSMDVLPILEFLGTCNVPDETVNGKTSSKWFLLKLMPMLTSLITHDSAEVRLCLQSLFLCISPFISSIC